MPLRLLRKAIFAAYLLAFAAAPLSGQDAIPPGTTNGAGEGELQSNLPEQPHPDAWFRVQDLFATSCLDCHQADSKEGELDLTQFTSPESIVASREIWEKVRLRVLNGEMPPPGSEPVSLDDRQWLNDWVQGTFQQLACANGPKPGPHPLRRLNRSQYSNTVRDLLQIHFDAGHGLPADGAGGEGFDNAAETLFLSPIHGEKYLEAAKESLSYAAKDNRAREAVIIAKPSETLSDREAARKIIKHFADRAFRRPATDDDTERLLVLFDAALKRGETFDQAIWYSLQGVMVSPQFLFLIEPQVDSDQAVAIDDFSLASRLSYFLWDTMPDDRLLEAARNGELKDTERLQEIVRTMLKSQKLWDMADSFVGQWLETRAVGRQKKPDSQTFPRFTGELADSFRNEPVMLFMEILRENRSLLDLIDCDYTFVNDDLANFYGIRKLIKEELNQQLRKVDLPADSKLGGIITMAGPLTASSYPHRTSPVLRGKWILEVILGTPAPPPPPNVPTLSEKSEDVSGKSLRERLEMHRADPNCASCHDRLDPMGFCLENFDASGRWRDRDSGLAIDSKSVLPDGRELDGSEDLKEYLVERKDLFIRQITTRLLAYSLGRGLVDSDYCTVEAIVDDLEKNEYQSHRLIFGILNSAPFRMTISGNH